MSYPPSIDEGASLPDSGVLEVVRTTSSSDFETMKRLRVVQPADSEMMERLLNPETRIVYRQNKPVVLDCPELRFIAEWKRLEGQAIIAEHQVRYWSKALYARFTLYLDWAHRPDEIPDYKRCWSREHQHLSNGLAAVADLFAEESSSTFRFQPAEKFPQFKECPEGTFKPGELACSFHDWRQGFTLGLLRFGAATPDDPFVRETVNTYQTDDDFMKRYMKERNRGPRLMLSVLRQFAMDWDTHVVPLRFFTQAAASNFVFDQYHHTENDQSRFRRVFFQGGNKKDCPGLKLKSAKPSIVWGWSKHLIKLNAAAAATHGYNAALLANVLRERYARPVSV
jgi:hypothetical protein